MLTSDHQATGVTWTHQSWAEILTDIEAFGRLSRTPKQAHDQRKDEEIETTWVQVKSISTEADIMVQFAFPSEYEDSQENTRWMTFQRASDLPRKGTFQEPDGQWIQASLSAK